jgi:2-oxoglutarate ferredoxin oxidoreductase subunit gamma
MGSRYEIRLSGAGGHGLLLAGKVLAEAAAIYDGRTATQAQSYGPEARGGVSRSDVVVSDGDIDFPVANRLDFLLAMTQESVEKYIGDMKSGGTVLVDASLVESVPDGDYRVVRAPIIDTARDRVGKPITANLVAVGLIAGLSDVVTIPSLESAVRARVPRGTEDANLAALKAGIELSGELGG